MCNFRSDRLKEQFFSRSHQSCFFSRSRTRINLAKTNVYMSWETARLACPVSSLKTLYCSLLKRCCLAGKAVFECQSERRCKMLNAVVCAFWKTFKRKESKTCLVSFQYNLPTYSKPYFPYNCVLLKACINFRNFNQLYCLMSSSSKNYSVHVLVLEHWFIKLLSIVNIFAPKGTPQAHGEWALLQQISSYILVSFKCIAETRPSFIY